MTEAPDPVRTVTPLTEDEHIAVSAAALARGAERALGLTNEPSPWQRVGLAAGVDRRARSQR